MDKAEVLYSSYLVNCVLNAFSAYTAIMLNIVIIHAMRKTSPLPTPLKTLLLSLAVSDLGVGLVVQPYYIALLVKWMQQNTESSLTYTMQMNFFIVMDLFSCASLFGVLAISVDRFLAIHLHLRYQELVTHRRVVAVVISIWVFSTLLSFMNNTQFVMIVFAVILGLCFICITIIYLRIYFAVRRHTNQMQALQVQQELQNDEMTNFARSMKSAVATFYVYLVFVICYLPGFCSVISFIKATKPTSALNDFRLYSCTLIFLNSSLNPVIYCWKMRHIRHAIMDILRNIFPSQD